VGNPSRNGVAGRSVNLASSPSLLARQACVKMVSLSKGPFDALNFIIGVTLTILILAYEINNKRTLAQSVALGAVLGLCSLLYLGYLTERFVFHTPSNADDSKVTHPCFQTI
jgi:hypothetical protein